MEDLKLIVAIGKDGAIGKQGSLIWRIPSDLKRFKSLTLGHPVIMGRKTWESLPKRPLPGRKNIVLTRQKDFNAEGAYRAGSIEEAIAIAGGEAFIIGGAEIYKVFLPLVSELDLTIVDAVCPDADAFLNIDLNKDWILIEETPGEQTSDGICYNYAIYRRKV